MTATRKHTGQPAYVAREETKGLHAYHMMASRKQGPDARDQLADMVASTEANLYRARRL